MQTRRRRTPQKHVTGHLRPTGRRWPVTAISVSSAFAESARRSICRNSGREGERAISADSGLFSGSVAKSCGNLLRSHAHWPAPFQAFSGGCQHGTSPNSTVSGGVFELLAVHVAWLCNVFRSVYRIRNICEFEWSFRSRLR